MTETDTPQPGERDALERPTWLLEQINSRRKASMHSLYSPGNLGLLADWIAQLEQESAAAPDIAAERINTLTRDLARLRSAAQDVLNDFHIRAPGVAEFCAQCEADWDKHAPGCAIGRLQSALAPAQEGDRPSRPPHPYTSGTASVPQEGVPFAATDVSDCSCRECLDARQQHVPSWERITATRMIVCPKCRNKRCPHADSHRYACTGSNELGQVGVPITPTPEAPHA